MRVSPTSSTWGAVTPLACVIVCFLTLASPTLPLVAEAVARASVSSKETHDYAKKVEVPGVGDFGEVTPFLYRGAQPSREGFARLSKMGVDIVVDLRGDRKGEREMVTRLGMRYEPIAWFCMRPKDVLIARFLVLLRDNPQRKIFVHCTTGIDRTGMMVAAYRMVAQGWTANEAMAEMKAFGFSRFHQTICWGLGSYERKFPREFATDPAFKSLREASNKTP